MSGEREDQRPVPPPWDAMYVAVGAVNRDQRRSGPREASFTAMRDLSGVSVTALGNMAYGVSKSLPGTIRKVADALKVEPKVLTELMGRPAMAKEPYVPPKEADQLSPRQRVAVNELIRAIVAVPDNVRHLPGWGDAPQEYAARTVFSDVETRQAAIRNGSTIPTDG